MTDKLIWRDVRRDVNNATKHFETGLSAIETGSINDVFKAHIVQHAFLAGYTSVESAIRRIFSITGEPIPSGPDFHRMLLINACEDTPQLRPAIFSREMFDQLDELRAFRHIAVHGYDRFSFDGAKRAIEAARAVAIALSIEFEHFVTSYDRGDSDQSPPVGQNI